VAAGVGSDQVIDAALETAPVPDAARELPENGGWDDELLEDALAELEEAEKAAGQRGA